jgi:hypothetical protein
MADMSVTFVDVSPSSLRTIAFGSSSNRLIDINREEKPSSSKKQKQATKQYFVFIRTFSHFFSRHEEIPLHHLPSQPLDPRI